MLVLECICPKSIFAKCTRLACLLSFASLFLMAPHKSGSTLRESHKGTMIVDKNGKKWINVNIMVTMNEGGWKWIKEWIEKQNWITGLKVDEMDNTSLHTSLYVFIKAEVVKMVKGAKIMWRFACADVLFCFTVFSRAATNSYVSNGALGRISIWRKITF